MPCIRVVVTKDGEEVTTFDSISAAATNAGLTAIQLGRIINHGGGAHDGFVYTKVPARARGGGSHASDADDDGSRTAPRDESGGEEDSDAAATLAGIKRRASPVDPASEPQSKPPPPPQLAAWPLPNGMIFPFSLPAAAAAGGATAAAVDDMRARLRAQDRRVKELEATLIAQDRRVKELEAVVTSHVGCLQRTVDMHLKIASNYTSVMAMNACARAPAPHPGGQAVRSSPQRPSTSATTAPVGQPPAPAPAPKTVPLTQLLELSPF